MGKWLSRVIEQVKSERENYQDILENNTDKTDKIHYLNIFDPDIRRKPRLDLLTEIELEAFNGWYATMRKPEHGMSHEEATLMAWRFLMESMEIMCRNKRGRYQK